MYYNYIIAFAMYTYNLLYYIVLSGKMAERDLWNSANSRRFIVRTVLLSRKRNQALNHAWKFETKVKGKLPTQFPNRRDLIDAAIHVGVSRHQSALHITKPSVGGTW